MAEDANPEEVADELGFRLFAISSGLAALVLFAERDHRFVTAWGLVPMNNAVPLALAVAMVAFPGNMGLFLAYWALNTYFLLLRFPWNNTNQTLTFFIGLGVLASAAVCMVRARTHRVSASALFREFGPILRLCTVVLYFWTIWQKLNFDFLSPETSCATRLTIGLLNKVGLGGEPESVGLFAVIMTVLVESALPIGLFFARTQRLTALLGLGFHWVLGTLGFSGFSATMFALLGLFLVPLPAQVFSGYRRRIPLNRAVFAGYLFLLVLSHFGVGGDAIKEVVWYALPAIVGALYVANRGELRGAPLLEPPWRTLTRPHPALVVPLLMFLNGTSPYLGFKTEYSFAMYSNLRTEGGTTNHVVLRKPLSVFGYQLDLVEVEPGTDQKLFETLGGRRVTRYELTTAVNKLAAAGKRDIRVVMKDERGRHEYPNAERSEINVKPGFFESRLLSFRKIVPAEKGKCAH